MTARQPLADILEIIGHNFNVLLTLFTLNQQEDQVVSGTPMLGDMDFKLGPGSRRRNGARPCVETKNKVIFPRGSPIQFMAKQLNRC